MAYVSVTPAVIHYRRLPTLTRSDNCDRGIEYPAEAQQRCDQILGHTLIIHNNRIICACCGATWKDEGF